MVSLYNSLEKFPLKGSTEMGQLLEGPVGSREKGGNGKSILEEMGVRFRG